MNNTENNQEFFLNTDFEVADIKIDPDYWLISKTDKIVHSNLNEANSEIIIFPNPFKDKLNVFGAPVQKSFQLNIFSADGKLIKVFNTRQNVYDLSDIDSGIYILKIYLEDNVLIRKMIKR